MEDHAKTGTTAKPKTHTPGPWYAYSPLASGVHAGHHYKVANSRPCGVVQDEDGYLVPDFPDWDRSSKIICTTTDDDDSRANARLIAAAPSLLDACKAALRILEQNGLTYDTCRDMGTDVCVDCNDTGLSSPISDVLKMAIAAAEPDTASDLIAGKVGRPAEPRVRNSAASTNELATDIASAGGAA